MIRLLVLAVISVHLLGAQAYAQIARDAVAASAPAGTTGFTHTITHDCGSGSDRFAVYLLHTTVNDVTGVTANGTAMSLADKSGNNQVQLWVLHNPSSGSQNFVATNSGFHFMQGVVKCYTGAQQSSTPDAVSSSTDQATFTTSLSMSVTTSADNSWGIYGVHCSNTGSACSAGTGSSLVGQRLDGTQGSINLFDSNAAITPAGAYSMQATHGSNINLNGSLISIAPAGGGGASPVLRGTLLGVGP